jgi:tetratricopeptide (TPR) repeat protein
MISRKFLFYLVTTILVPLLLLALIEGALRFTQYGKRPPLFVPVHVDSVDQEYLRVNPNVAKRYLPDSGYLPYPPRELFLRNKPKNGYRIFVLGGSTAAGWPYPNNVLFSRILRQRLSDTFSDREIEIINTGIAAINSYTLLDFMDEILEQKPDAILMYTGHNEFYGAFGAASTISYSNIREVVNLYLYLQRFRTVSLLRDLILEVRTRLGHSSGDDKSYHQTLMSQVIDQESILLGSPTYEQGKLQFQGNLREIMKKAKDSGVPVIISELVSNIHDHEPFVSEGSLSLEPADEVYQQARKLESENNIEAAYSAYYRAKDLDAMRFRASEEFNQIIHQVGDEYGAPVVPMKSFFELASPNRFIGKSLMLEHLHPNVEGHFIMSQAFFETMSSNGFIENAWDKDKILPDSHYRQTWGITEIDRALGKIRTINLMDHWPFKPELESSGAAKKYIPESKAEALAKNVFFNRISFRNSHYEMANYFISQGNYEQATKEYKALITADPIYLKNYHNAASSLLNAGQIDRAASFLYQSLKLSDSGFANKWIGHILLSKSKLHESIQYLEKAVKLRPDDPQVLFNLGRAYALTGQVVKARTTVAELETVDPRFPDIDNLKQMLSQKR